MANEEQLAILKQGVDVWNEWREHNNMPIDLRGADIRGTDLMKVDTSVIKFTTPGANGLNLKQADLRQADLRETNFNGANLYGADMREALLWDSRLFRANLNEANLTGADLRGANLLQANLSNAFLMGADLRQTYFRGAILKGAYVNDAFLRGADLSEADLSEADLTGADLIGAQMVGTQLQKANLTSCRVFGISAWKVNLESAIQSDLVITPAGEPIITVDNLEIAQFIYLLINNPKLRDVLDTVGKKAVLILGRFTDERKMILEAIREELRKKDYIPILFDFDRPPNRDLTATVSTLAHMSRFIIADLTDPSSIPHELATIVPHLRQVAIRPLILKGNHAYGMFQDFQAYPWVLPTHEYESQAQLIAELSEKVIAPAEAKVDELRPAK